MESKQLLNIDIDTIKELRKTDWKTARKLLLAFREDVKKTKRDELNNIKKIDRLKKKALGICSEDSCLNKVYKKYNRCKKHFKQNKRQAHEYYKRNKLRTNRNYDKSKTNEHKVSSRLWYKKR